MFVRELQKLMPSEIDEGLFSIVVPVFNGVRNLQRCIDSVVSQSYPHKELIIIDGGSTDGTVELIEENSERVSKWISGQDGGIYAAFNRGVQVARGEWFLFLGSDDVFWGTDVLTLIAHRLDREWSGQKVVYARVAVLDESRNLLEFCGEPWSWYMETPVGRWTFEHQGIFHHRSLFEEHGLFDSGFRLCGDHELLMRALKSSDALFIEDVIVAGFSLGGASSLPRNLKLMIQEKQKALCLNGFPRQSVASRTALLKMWGFEVIRALLGLRVAEKMSRALYHS
jgi:glycosyltransferase involved in cell wall biosynthesis